MSYKKLVLFLTLFVIPLQKAIAESLYSPLHQAVRNNDYKAVAKLIKEGADVKKGKNKLFGKTPLHYAAINQNAKLVKILIKKGAEVNCRDIDGKMLSQPMGCV